MSGILGILTLDGAPASTGDLSSMASLLERRGPERTGTWCEGPAGLGHTLLTTTPELAFERQPFVHRASGCTITADVRLDNREELLGALNLLERSERAAAMGDAELIVEAYLAWGEASVARLLGDFAFALWDPKRRAMFCARDQFGMRPFYYHHSPGRFFACASEPRAILVLPQVPYRINEGRVADYLVWELQWIDYTSTFFEHISRLPPAHSITVTLEGMQVKRYWTLEPGPELRLPSNEAYAEALLEVLTASVTSRLRGSGPPGVLLSGGLDSSSVVAIARSVLASLPLHTFSGVSPNPAECVETRSIQAVLAMEGLQSHLIDHTALDPHDVTAWDYDEPFDRSMVMARYLYLSAGRQGVRSLIDGAASDVILGAGTHIVRLMRKGQWMAALREARGISRFRGEPQSVTSTIRAVRVALTPSAVRQAGLRFSPPLRAFIRARQSILNPGLARRISLGDRLRTLDRTYQRGWDPNYQRECATTIHPNLTAGRERFGRVASAAGVEARDPFLDRRFVAFCLTLPGSQRLHDGWPKIILRRAMAGRLPESVRWRRISGHLGWRFSAVLLKASLASRDLDRERLFETVSPFVDRTALRKAWDRYVNDGDEVQEERVQAAITLGDWLQRSSARPTSVR